MVPLPSVKASNGCLYRGDTQPPSLNQRALQARRELP